MDIANPILNLEKQRKCKHKILYIPGNMDKVDCSQFPFHNSSTNSNKNTRFRLVCSMENGHKLLTTQSPNSLLQNEDQKYTFPNLYCK